MQPNNQNPLRRLLNIARRMNLEEDGHPEPEVVRTHPWKRRSFLKATVAASAAFALPEVAWAAGRRGRFDHDVAIVGGGICGLNAARILHKAGTPAHVYEGSRRLGGRILTRVSNGLTYEFGAEFINKDHRDMLEIVEELGLELFNRDDDLASDPVTPSTAYFFDGVRYTEVEIARRLRKIARKIGRDARLVSRNFDRAAARFDPLSVADYLDDFDQSAQGPLDPVARVLLEALVRGEYGVEPENSTALQLIFALPVVNGREVEILTTSDETFNVKGGNAQIVQGLADGIGRTNITTGTVLDRIDEFPDGGYKLYFRNGRRATARFVIVTIPFTILRKVRLNFCGRVPRAFFDAIQSYELGKNEKVFVEFNDRVWQGRQGWRGELWSDRVATTWESTRSQPLSETAALTLFLGGDQTSRLIVEGKRAVANDLVDYLDGSTPGLKQAQTGRVRASNWQRNPFALGAYNSFPPGVYSGGPFLSWFEGETPAESTELRRRGFLLAGEHTSDAFYGYMNGGAETGRLAATSVLNVLMRRSARER